jgi:hypothetical protein
VFLRVVFAGEICLDLPNRRPVGEGPADELHIIFESQAVGALSGNRFHAAVEADGQVNRVRDPAPRADVLDQTDSAVAFAQYAKPPGFERLEVVVAARQCWAQRLKLCVQGGHPLRQRIDQG